MPQSEFLIKFYQSVIESLPIGTVALNSELIVASANPAVAKVLGSSADLLGSSAQSLLGEICDPASAEALARALRQALLGKTTFAQDIASNRDGRWFSLSVAPLASESGETMGLILLFEDITRRRQAKTELEQLLTDAERSRRALLSLSEDQVRANTALRASNEGLRALSRRVLEVQETERRALARELHDEIGGVLTALKLNLQTLQRGQAGDRLDEVLGDGLILVDGAIQSVRSMSLDLRPVILDDLGLIPALKWYGERQATRSGVPIEMTLGAIDLKSLPQIESACFRIVQESVTNALRYANARRIDIALLHTDGGLSLEIADDGGGFDVVAARKRSRAGASTGLVAMEERAQLLGGRFSVDSAPGAGTRVTATFAVPEGGIA